jgi:hypothetical protein
MVKPGDRRTKEIMQMQGAVAKILNSISFLMAETVGASFNREIERGSAFNVRQMDQMSLAIFSGDDPVLDVLEETWAER